MEIIFLINMIGIIIVNISSFVCFSLYNENRIPAFIVLLFGNILGLILNKYDKIKLGGGH